MTQLKTGRQIAAEALLRVETAKSYSNIVLDRLLQPDGTAARERAFASALFYGVLEKKLTLDYVIGRYSSKPVEKLDPLVRQLLRMAVYQIVYMDSVPAPAAVHESVELAKSLGKGRASGFVNGVLRSFLRDGGEIRLPEPEDDRIQWLSLAYSVPQQLIRLWAKQYPQEDLEAFLQGMTGRAPLFARVNSCRTDPQALCDKLREEEVEAEVFAGFENCVILHHTGSLEAVQAFRQGLFHIQDLSSQVCVSALAARPGMRVLDCCAAPGGKTFTLAQRIKDEGEILALDLYPQKVEMIRAGAKRLGLDCIKASAADAGVYSDSYGLFDRVLCDAPCSGLGIIRRKPEIRYKSLDTLRDLPAVQYKILQSAAQYVKKGGRLVYSTCTLNRRENDEVTRRFLQEHPDFSAAPFPKETACFLGLDGQSSATLMPHRNGGDGFYFALFARS